MPDPCEKHYWRSRYRKVAAEGVSGGAAIECRRSQWEGLSMWLSGVVANMVAIQCEAAFTAAIRRRVGQHGP